MEVTEMTLWLARLLVLALMYVFLLALVFALVADVRAAGARQPASVPGPAPAPVAVPARADVPVQRLTVAAGTLPAQGRDFPLFGPLEIGRSTSCDISIANRFVSTYHARVYQANEQWVVEDLGSTNGTLLNGTPLAGAHPLRHGDRIQIGDTELVAQ